MDADRQVGGGAVLRQEVRSDLGVESGMLHSLAALLPVIFVKCLKRADSKLVIGHIGSPFNTR